MDSEYENWEKHWCLIFKNKANSSYCAFMRHHIEIFKKELI